MSRPKASADAGQNVDVLIGRCCEACDRIRAQLRKVVSGQEKLIEQILMAVLARGHILVEGVPGLGKTQLVRSLAEATGLVYRRIQFTSDLMPGEVTDANIIQPSGRNGPDSTLMAGPLFANLILVDEINRGPPKTQAALLGAMHERQVHLGDKPYPLPDPFFVLATQNLVDQEGCYPLCQTALDRFLLHIRMDYPSGSEEWEIARRVLSGRQGRVEAVVTRQDLLDFQSLLARMPVSDQVMGYAWALVRASRPNSPESPEFVERWVQWGAGPRGLVALLMAARARAVLRGRHSAQLGDIQAVAPAALRHRMSGNDVAREHALSTDTLMDMLIEAVPPDQPYENPSKME